MNLALNDLELFMHDKAYMPALIKIALVHSQFETIHPFLDDNGRMGRLLITFWLCNEHILEQPLLYLSYYFKQNRTEYYDRLMDVRLKGDWEGWIRFFLKGVAEVSDEATNSAKEIKIKEAATLLYVSYPTASSTVNEFCKLGILRDGTPERERGKRFLFYRYLNILEKGTEL